ncbi:unnamed protein product [Macrosiphum euphorbiae]|uniref:Zinc finger PHD-type domain-containing protein n=1 Tax=Macrosiphum euphorbiae TaxID=13131 RepID=A0AAV0WHQ7_9HEMI|nr:unnamed protein product [Macrosiphum euphorbiae]
MSVACDKCSLSVSLSKNKIVCIKCNGTYNTKCASTFTSQNEKFSWICESCILISKNEKNLTIRKKHNSSNNEDINIVLIREDISKLITKIETLENSVSFSSNKINDFSEKLDLISESVKNINKKFSQMEIKLANLEKQVDMLKGENNQFEETFLLNNITITGIPTTILNVNCPADEIINAFRINTKQNNGKLVVRCVSKFISRNLYNNSN